MKCERMVPAIYLQSWDFRTMCRIFDAEFNLLSYYTNHILDCYSPEHCPENLLPELAEHIGFDYNEFKTVMYNRVVLKHFIHDMIRYRGSVIGISQAAAIDIRYRQVYGDTRLEWDAATKTWEEVPEEEELVGTQVPMQYNEGIPVKRCWIDIDNPMGIIYLFIIAEHYFPRIPSDATEEEKQKAINERMRRLLDLAYLQEYVRPVGMYLLPMVATKVNPRTDLTVKAIRIPPVERTHKNGVLGTPNASLEHKYDRIAFARTESPDEMPNIEPWVRTLYHSQLAGNLQREYFTKPVYHIEGKFLYYDHDELMTIYQEIMNSRPESERKLKIGDSLYNPNRFQPPQDYSYGPDPDNQPKSLQEEGKAVIQTEPLKYDDHGLFDGETRYAQDIPKPEVEPVPQNDYPTYLYATEYGTQGETDSGTNKNLMINLFDIDDLDTGLAEYTGPDDVNIAGKGSIDKNPVPYDPATNDGPTGTDAMYTVRNPEPDADPNKYIP